MSKKYIPVLLLSVFTHLLSAQNSVTDIDGNTYTTVNIGEQEWMAENLSVSHYRNGDPLDHNDSHQFWQNTTEGVWTWYDGNESYENIYGKLYNWYAVVDPRGICPAGWRTPTDADWQQLLDFIDPNARGNNNSLGIKLRSRRQVNSPLGDPWDTEEHPRWDSHGKRHGTDNYDFGAIPGGSTSMGNAFVHLGRHSYFWSLDEQNDNTAWARVIRFSHRGMSRTAYLKQLGFSVRCIKGEDQEPEIMVPEVRIVEVEETGSTHATIKGSVTSNGGSSVTQRGMVWSTEPGATLESNSGLTTDGEGWSQFQSNLTGLSPETIYYVRAYASNSVGVGYGEEMEIETFSEINIDDCMVAYYPFNGNANDESGNNNNGDINGAELVPDRFGNDNSAYYFNNQSWIEVPHNETLNFNFLDEYSLSMWVKVDEDHNWGSIIEKWVNSFEPYPYAIRYNQETDLLCIYRYVGGLPQDSLKVHGDCINGSEYGFNSSAYNHITTVFKEHTLEIYLNGSLVSSAPVYIPGGDYANDHNLYIGRRGGNIDRYFKGIIDDIRIIACPLSPNQVNDLYNQEKPEEDNLFQLNININPEESGATIGSGNYSQGEEINLTATPNNNFQFTSWTLGEDTISTESTFTFTMPANDVMITANFEPILPTSNKIIVLDVTGNAGETVTITVDMENSSEITAFQMDFQLPEGFEYVEGSYLLSDRAPAHEYSESIIDNNTLRLVAYSGSNETIEGTEGTLFTFTLQTPHQEGSWELAATSVNLTNRQLENVFDESIAGTITIESTVTGDNTLHIIDVTGTPGSQLLIEVEMNNLTDITAFQMDFVLPEGFSYVEDSYALSERAQGHATSQNVLDNNTLRLVAYSMENELFQGSNGVLLSFMVTAPSTEGTFSLSPTNVNLTNINFENVFDGAQDGVVTVISD